MNPYTSLDMGHSCSPSLRNETTEERLKRLTDCGASAIDERLCEIEREWSAGRATKVALGLVILVGMVLGLTVGGWLYAIPVLGSLFLLQYLFTRTSLLAAGFQKLGLRSGQEIDEEKFALKALRGDFAALPTVHDVEDRDAVNRMEGEGGPAVEFETEKVDSREAVLVALHATRS